MKEFKVRASASGKLMTNPRSGTGLSETAKSYLDEIFIEETFGIKKEIHSKYITKGLQVEESSLDLYTKAMKTVFIKNDEFFENDFIKGTPDIILENTIIDIKSSWSLFTFMDAKESNLNKLYYWQMQSYMALADKDTAKLVYCLVDTPDQLIQDEKRKLMWKIGVFDENDLTAEAFAEIENSHYFTNIPIEKRYFEKVIERNNDDIQRLYDKVIESRLYLSKKEF